MSRGTCDLQSVCGRGRQGTAGNLPNSLAAGVEQVVDMTEMLGASQRSSGQPLLVGQLLPPVIELCAAPS
jgi:hypothetical protein